MRNNKEKYMNHFTDFIIRNLPFRNLIDSMKENIIINNETYKIEELFKYIYYHPLDLLTIRDISNADRKDEYVKQFVNNLYLRYAYNEMDFIKNNIRYDDKVYSIINEINYFPEHTSEFLKYRLSHYESESRIRGGRVVTFSGVPDNGYGYLLSQSDPSSKYIWAIVDNYLMIDNEDKFDFYTQYIPFINYFLKLYYNNITKKYIILDPSNPEENKDVPNANLIDESLKNKYNNFTKKLSYFDISNSRYNSINDVGDFNNYLDINTNKNIIENYDVIINNIIKSIYLYNIMDTNVEDILNIIMNDTNYLLLNEIYSEYLPNSSKLYVLVGLRRIIYEKSKQNKNISNLYMLDSFVSILLYLLERYYENDITTLNESKRLIKQYYKDNLNSKNSVNLDSINIIKENINNNIINITLDEDEQSRYNLIIATNPEIIVNYASRNYFNISSNEDNTSNVYKKAMAFFINNFIENNITNENIINNLSQVYTQNTDFINITYDDLNNLKIKYINNYNINLDIKKIINDNLEIIRIYKDNVLYDTNIKMNYKSFISLLPTIYYIIFYNQPINRKIYRKAIIQEPPIEEEISTETTKRARRVRFNPFNVEETIIEPKSVFVNKSKNYLYDTLFWSGISIDDFNKFPLYIKTIILDSCLILGRQINDDGSSTCVLYHDINNNDVTKICIIPYPYTANRTMYDVFKQVSDKLRSMYSYPVNYNINNNEKHLNLSKKGNYKFMNKLAECKDIKDLIQFYVMVRDTDPGHSEISIPPNQELYLAITLLDLLGFSPTLSRRNTSIGFSYYIQTDRQVSARNLIYILSRNYPDMVKSKELSDVVINILSPILAYLRYVLNYYRTNNTTLTAGSNNAGHDCCIPIKSNPLDLLINIDTSFTDSDNILDIMNRDMFNLDNDIFRQVIQNNIYSAGSVDIVDIITDNIPQNIYMKTNIIDKMYDKIFAGESISDILDIQFDEDINDNFNYNDVNMITNDLMKKLRKLLKKTTINNLEDNAMILKSQMLSSINNVFNRYSCMEKIPTQYLINIRTLLKQYSNENIKIDEDLKNNIQTIISNIHSNTKDIIKIITTLSAGIDLVRALKRSNANVENKTINLEFLKKLCDICKDSFYKYNRNNDIVYKNLLKDVFNNDNEINNDSVFDTC
ncbi:putative core protein [Betaentomopoxvirus amoorei]|uniref:AMV139 n=1 Tax=Amsacta moorei entomopoxvirus TaxID=28321 RepID=Q9EMR0_AMEPV|nr:putative core protein [Amsacta moorei entomopoxvirus]AAG02845.1 AMV139 [Amsacta moorei entomopoxvirus]